MSAVALPADLPGPVPLYEATAERGALRCRLCQRRLIQLPAVTRHAAKHTAAGDAEGTGSHRAFGPAMRWRLTEQGTSRWWATRASD